MGKVIAIRGATTAESNTKDSIVEATKEMLEELVSANDLDIDCDINFPKEFTTDELIDLTVECEKYALNYDSKIKNSEGCEYAYSQSNNLILNSSVSHSHTH